MSFHQGGSRSAALSNLQSYESPLRKRRRLGGNDGLVIDRGDLLYHNSSTEDSLRGQALRSWQSSTGHLNATTADARKNELKILYKAYSKVKSNLSITSSEVQAATPVLNEAFYALLESSKGCTSVRVIAAELIARYAGKCPTGLQAAGTVLLQLCDWAGDEVVRSGNTQPGGLPMQAAQAAFRALPAFMTATAFARSARALPPMLCSAIQKEVALYLLRQLHGYPLLAAAAGMVNLTIHVPLVGAPAGLMGGQQQSQASNGVAALAASAALRALAEHPEAVLGACVEALRSTDPLQRREGLHFLLQATLPTLPPPPPPPPPQPQPRSGSSSSPRAEGAEQKVARDEDATAAAAAVAKEEEVVSEEEELRLEQEKMALAKSLASKALEGRPDAHRWLAGALQQLRRTVVAPDVLAIALPRLQALQQAISSSSLEKQPLPEFVDSTSFAAAPEVDDSSVRLWSREAAAPHTQRTSRGGASAASASASARMGPSSAGLAGPGPGSGPSQEPQQGGGGGSREGMEGRDVAVAAAAGWPSDARHGSASHAHPHAHTHTHAHTSAGGDKVAVNVRHGQGHGHGGYGHGHGHQGHHGHGQAAPSERSWADA
eukprot:jgi/Mesen1/4466/ME000227S03479